MRTFRPMVIAALVALLGSQRGFAAGESNFSGHWLLDKVATKNTPVADSLDIKQTNSTIEVDAKTGAREEKRTYIADGATQATKVEHAVPELVTAQWQGQILQIAKQTGNFRTIETWQLTDGGKTLQIDRKTTGKLMIHGTSIYHKR